MIHAIAFPTSITFNYRTIVTVRRMINAFSLRVYSFLLAGMFNNVRHCELLAAHSFNLMNGSERSLIFHLGRRSVLCRRRRRNENETGDTIVSYDFFVFWKNTGRWRLPLKKKFWFLFFFLNYFFTFRSAKIENFIPIRRFEFFHKIVFVENCAETVQPSRKKPILNSLEFNQEL